MRIIITSPNERTIRLALPTRMLFNGFTARIGAGTINKYIPENIKISSRDLSRLMKEINRMKHKYPGLELVNVESGSGETVKIML